MRPPTGRQLQLAGTQHELFSRTLEHLAHPVCDRHRANGVGARCGGVVACGKIVGLAVVTVARSLRDHRARRPDPGAGKTTLVDDTFHRESGARHVAHAGETPHERTLRFLCRLEVEVRLRSTQQRSHRQRRHHGVDMGVDQPGHQGAPAACDHQRPSGKGRFSGSMALIFWPSTTTRTPVNTTGPLGASGARASVDLEGSTNAPTNKAAPPPRKVRRFRVPCRCWFSRAKAQETG